MLIHDSFSSVGVTLAIVRELLAAAASATSGDPARSPSTEADDATSRFANAVRQLAQLPWFVKNVGVKVILSIGLGKLLGRIGRPVPDWPY